MPLKQQGLVSAFSTQFDHCFWPAICRWSLSRLGRDLQIRQASSGQENLSHVPADAPQATPPQNVSIHFRGFFTYYQRRILVTLRTGDEYEADGTAIRYLMEEGSL